MSPTVRLKMLSPLGALFLGGCATIGSMMSPYSEKFSCKNDDHGQCIHPERAYNDATAGVASRSQPAVTNDKSLLNRRTRSGVNGTARDRRSEQGPYVGYRDSIYREMQGLIDDPVTPMLRPERTVRTLILPYADLDRPERLYMPRYVYSILERPQWVVGDYLVTSPGTADKRPVLDQVQDRHAGDPASAGSPASAPALPEETGQ